jgi:HD superfamily phosphohydrolase YqeK
MELCREVLRRGTAEIIAEDGSIVLLAIPVLNDDPPRMVAIAPFLIAPTEHIAATRAAAALGFDPAAAVAWATSPPVWESKRLLHLAELCAALWKSDFRNRQLKSELSILSGHMAAAYEELSLLYGLTQKLKISDSIEDLGRKALEWLAEAISAEGFVLELLPQQPRSGDSAQREATYLEFGSCNVERAEMAELIDSFSLNQQSKPLIVNDGAISDRRWPLARIQQAIVVPLTEGENLFGWLAAFNRTASEEFGSSEASLLASVAAILGIHTGNLELYRQQAEFLADVVRALTSAIDAKDPYTCGHSDRVAQIAVRLAEHLGCTPKELETIYLSGLLHDIGKIGIDDHVLRKPGKLTEAEYEHIKLHAEIGYRILKDLRQLGQVLPAVRHHHEAWNGSGYPLGLAGEEIPLYARIVAVADSFDAMSSDRPYRRGMEDERLDEVLRAGAGKQWDRSVVEAFFAARDEIRKIVRPELEMTVSELSIS